MRVLSGTSGFSYDEWKGSFYPEDIDSSGMLRFYASQLPSVEINNTFYRMPRAEVVRTWSAQVPDGFRFVLKASRRITHQHQLVGADDSVAYLFKVATELGAKLGPVLFQLPPFLRKDAGRLDAFCAGLPKGARAAFEFRHASWFCDEVYDVLNAHGAALCGGDAEDPAKDPPLQVTADFGYFRLRRDEYDDARIAAWSERILAQPWDEAYVFFKHETLGPEFALALDAICAGRPSDLAKVRAVRSSGPGVAPARPARSGQSSAKAARSSKRKRG